MYEKALGPKIFFEARVIKSVAITNATYIQKKYAEVYKIFTKINIV